MDSSANPEMPAANTMHRFAPGSQLSADVRRARLRVDGPAGDEQLELDFGEPKTGPRPREVAPVRYGGLEDWDLVRDVEPALPAPARPLHATLRWD